MEGTASELRYHPKIVLTENDITSGLSRIAHDIIHRHSMHPDVLVPIMNGALLFAADLTRVLFPALNPEVRCMKMSRLPSYKQPGKFFVDSHGGAAASVGNLRDKRVLLIDTVFDTGETIAAAKKVLESKQARSITSAVLVWKNLSSARGKPDFFGYDLHGDASYLYGYGLDRENRDRGLREIWKE